jgi:hypothetical protein
MRASSHAVRHARRAGALAIALAVGAGAALGQTTGPLSWPPAAQAAFDAELASTWTTIVPEIQSGLTNAVKNQVGTQHGQLTIDSLAVASMDFSSPPQVEVTPLLTGGVYSGEGVHLDIPKAGTGWAMTLAGHLSYHLNVKVLFLTIKKTIGLDVTLAATGVHASEEVDLDTSDPTLPVCTKTSPLQVDYQLNVKTGNALINLVLIFAKPFMDKMVRAQVDQALQSVNQTIAPLVGLPNKNPWGSATPAPGAFSQQPDLEKASLEVDAEIQKEHLPWNTILATTFDNTTYGSGNPVGYGGYGDSAIWTGHYLAGESFRWALTKDPVAQTNTARVLSGITDLLDAESPGGGHLSRWVEPMSWPGAAAQLASDPTAFQTTLHGVPYIAGDHISRDQYLGVMLGLGCAYDFLDDPAQKKLAGSLISRVVDYLVANDWVAMQHDNKTESAPFIQSSDKMVAFTALAAHVDPRFQPERDKLAPLVYTTWLSTWIGLIDPLGGYYGWNLGQGARYHAMRLETDPGRFMALERSHAMERRGIGHHENAYFQTVDAAVNPALATTVAPEILDELRRWTARPRRDFALDLGNDPTIAKSNYSVPLSFQKSASGTSGSLVPVTQLEATYVVPVEKRPCTDFLWQRDPFQLATGGDPHSEEAGVDLVLPYWMARFYKLVP